MSAWVVSDAHISYLVKAAFEYSHGGYVEYGGERMTREDRDRLGANLLSENIASVRYRYSDSEWDDMPGSPVAAIDYRYREPKTPLDPVTVLKQIRCYDYQSCEHPAWEASAAKAFCDTLTALTIGRLAGYDDAPWGIDE